MASGGFRPSYEAIYGADSRSADEALRLAPGTIIDNAYELEKPLGKGGMGAVYQCRHVIMGKQYALKLLEYDGTEPALWQRFQNEARAIAKLNHPNIVAIHNMGIDQGKTPYYVMDLVEGKTLSKLISERGRIPLEEALKIFIQVTYCLNFAHEQGIIHRDIKPANIMLTAQGQVKLLDFGLAKFTNSLTGQGLTATGEIFGSPSYMSPEQALGKAVDNRSDIYSTAVSLFECLTGVLPLSGKNAMQTIYKIQTERAPSLHTAGGGAQYPDSLEEVVVHGLEKDPEFRYQHMDQFCEDLRRVAQGKEPRYAGGTKPSLQAQTAQTLRQQDASTKETVKLRARAQENEEDKSLNNSEKNLIKLLIMAVIAIGAIGTGIGLIVLKPWTHNTPKVVEAPPKKPRTYVAPEIQAAVKAYKAHESEESKEEMIRNLLLDKASEEPPEIEDPNKKYATTPFFQGMSNGNRRFVFVDCPFLKIVDSINMDDQNLLHSKTDEFLCLLGQDLVAHVYDQFNAHPEQISRFGPNDLVGLNIELKTQASVDKLIERIAGWDKLQRLFISNAKLSDAGLKIIGKLPSLHFLRLSSVELNDELLAQSPLMTRLYEFERKGSGNAKALLVKLEQNKDLAQLSLDHSKLDHDDVKHIASIKSLRVLSIKDTKIGNTDLAELGSLNNLEKLYVAENNLDSSAFRKLRALPKLQEIEVGDPNLAAEVKKILGKQTIIR